MPFAENLAPLFADFGVVAVHGADTAKVLFDTPTRQVMGDMVLDEEPAIELAATSLPSLANGSAVTVDGTAYTVREVTLIDDGKLKRATLKAA